MQAQALLSSVKPPAARHGHGGGRSLRLLPIVVAVLLTTAANNLLRSCYPASPAGLQATQAETAQAQPCGSDGAAAASSSEGGGRDDEYSTPRWRVPDDWLSKIVVAVPLSPAGIDWVRASRSWRKGLRAAFVSDFTPRAEVVAEGAAHGDSFVFVNMTEIPYTYYGKAAMVPSMAHEHFDSPAGGGYQWLLYGDDDTLWNVDAVIDTVKGLDPELPHLISDHFWFWGHGGDTSKVIFHPARDAPRCLPCGFDKSRLRPEDLPPGFDPPLGCPYCTQELLCGVDGRKQLYNEDCSFHLKYPQDGEYLVHGGGGIIVSVGLMRRMSVAYMKECITTRFAQADIRGGDTLFSHCAFFTGVAPTDPGISFLDPSFNAFDWGGQLIFPVIDLYYKYLKKGCCDAQCDARLRALTTMHLRGMHFKEPEAGMDMMRELVRLRDIYLHLRGKAAAAGGHPALTPSWDNHKVCI